MNPICDKCNKEVERFDISSETFDFDITCTMYCHGEKEEKIFTQQEFINDRIFVQHYRAFRQPGEPIKKEESATEYKNADKFMQLVITCEDGCSHEQSVLKGSIMGVRINPEKDKPNFYNVDLLVVGMNTPIFAGKVLSYEKADKLKTEIEKQVAEFQDIHRADMLGQTQGK